MHADALALVTRFGLAAHPEGGFYRETFRSPRGIPGPRDGERRSASTAIYFLLPAKTFSALHCVAADEVWHHYDGDPLDLHLLDEATGHRVVRLGHDFSAGEVPQAVVPAGVLQAAVPIGERYAFCGCTVAPGFDFADFAMPSRGELLTRFPRYEAIIRSLTRS